jgi:DNA-binding protein HU-beta
MNKSELINEVADKTGLTKKDTKTTVDTVFEVVTDTLKQEAAKKEEDRDKVQIIGFGGFEVRDRAARKARNPQTGEEIEVPKMRVPKFRPAKALKEAVKDKRLDLEE